MTDPNPEYDIFERIALSAYERHFPNKRVKVNKHKHKLSPWITTGLIKSIKFHDKLYKRLKSCPQDSSEHNRMEYNLKTYNGYLNNVSGRPKENITSMSLPNIIMTSGKLGIL